MKLWIYLLSLFLINESALANTENVEKIKVTGSRIKRIDIEGPNPVVIYTKEDLENSGYNSVGDFLRDTTISHFGVSRGKAGSSATGNSFIAVKGEPSLILINGLRIAEDPDAHIVDLNLIPMNAIERIEILKDGGSALYGSDALGGVINFITKKDFNGAQLHAIVSPTLYPLFRGNFSSSSDDYLAGSQASAGAVFGKTGSNWSFIGALNARYMKNIKLNQREWGKNVFSGTGPEPLYFDKDGNLLSSTCPEKKKLGEKACKFDYSPYMDLMPTYYQLNSFVQGNYRTGEVEFYTQFLGSYKHSQYYLAPIPVSYSSKPYLQIPEDHKLAVGQGQALRISHRFMSAGRRDNPKNSWLADLTVGAKGYLSKTWDYDFSIKGAHIIKNGEEKNVLLRDKTIKAIQTGQYDPSNPTKSGLSPAIYRAKSKNNSSLIFSSLDFSGEAFSSFDAATGFQAYFQRYETDADRQHTKENILSGFGSDGKGSRYVGSYYIEAIKNFSEAFELQMAWRADYYSDFGLTNFGLNEILDSNVKLLDYLIGTPKIAFRFQAHPDILFRGSIGTSFKAPDLNSLYGSSSSSFPWLFDSSGCLAKLNQINIETLEGEAFKKEEFKKKWSLLKQDSDLIKKIIVYEDEVLSKGDLSEKQKKLVKDNDLVAVATQLYSQTDRVCSIQQYNAKFSSNKDLKPTQALVASMGSVVEMTDSFNFNIDLTYIRKNGIPSEGIFDSNGIGKKAFDAELLGINNQATKNINIERNPDGTLKNISVKPLNLKKSQKLFMDLGLDSKLDFLEIENGNTYYRNDFTLFLIQDTEDFPGFGLEKNIGEFGNPRWLNKATLGWQNDRHHVFFNLFSSAPVKRMSDPSKYFPLYTIFDVNYEYVISEKTKMNLNIYNFLNLGLNFYNKDESLVSLSLDSPFDEKAPNTDTRIDSDIYNINGAHFSVRVSHLL